jgi:hypothetical protein
MKISIDVPTWVVKKFYEQAPPEFTIEKLLPALLEQLVSIEVKGFEMPDLSKKYVIVPEGYQEPQKG